MESIGTALRRTIMLLAVAAGVGALVSWQRGQTTTPTPAAAPQWPPLPEPVPDEVAWTSPSEDGSAPRTHPIKAKDASGIFHVPGGRFYDRTKPDRCYATTAAAEADGYRQSKS
jgi:hypothetical protein